MSVGGSGVNLFISVGDLQTVIVLENGEEGHAVQARAGDILELVCREVASFNGKCFLAAHTQSLDF